ncbi:MAG: flagellar biosynthesis protein FlhF [Archangium sp.]|nr:flagellar biosynthesis protein FlhF [Archangium sp.]
MSTFRTFRAPDTRSALAMVKAALGSDAIIVATREVENGLFRPKEIEVTAAVPEATPAPAPARTNTADWAPRANVAPIRPPAIEDREPAPRRTSTVTNLRVAAFSPSAVQQTQNNLPTIPEFENAFASLTQSAPVTPMPSGYPTASPQGASLRFEAPDELQSLRSSMEEMRREMRRMTSQVRMEREMQLPPPAAELMSHLISRGVEDAIAEECVRQAITNAPVSLPNGVAPGGFASLGPKALESALRNALSERVVPGRAPWMADNRRRIVALVGPTGVGKTTTVAKIAARAVMETKQKVALITVDTYRIGASEQLQRYGEIMGLTTQVARDRVELNRAIEKAGNADLILIDSAGRSVSEAVARQAEMLRSVEGIQLYLTLSACTGPREMAAAADRYRALSPERLIVTKVDEAIGPGSLLSASVRIGRPIVAVSDGQRVPEDIHALSGAELVELIMTNDAQPKAIGTGGR